MFNLTFEVWPEIETHCSVLVINNCKLLGIRSMEELLRRVENPDQDFLETFGARTRREIEEIRKRIKEKKLVPPNCN
jgi:hypothetical protein